MEKLFIGQLYTKSVMITEDMVNKFAQVTGDNNPIHLDELYAKNSIFKTRIAHGMLQASILSGILGMEFPGPGTIYLSQTIKFTKPVFIDDVVTFNLKILNIDIEKNRMYLETICTNRADKTLLVGEAVVIPPNYKIRED